MPRPFRVPLLAAGMISLVAALWAGLVRMGWQWPIAKANWTVLHGPLMVCAFLGTVITLERAVGLGRKWAYLGPLAAALSALALLADAPAPAPQALSIAAAAVLFAVLLKVFLEERALFTFTMMVGALSWLVGDLLWLGGRAIPELVPWWMGFLVLTIAGERLELNRLLQPTSWTRGSFVGGAALVLLGAGAGLVHPVCGVRLLGAGFVALAAWLFSYDLARRTIRQKALTRFIAASLLLGYFWLGVSGALLLAGKPLASGPYYDATLHSLFLGFAFSMIFGHAPVIFPSILEKTIHYHPRFYAHLTLLHLSLIVRLTGDLAGWPQVRLIGGLAGAVAILLFIGNTVSSLKGEALAPGTGSG